MQMFPCEFGEILRAPFFTEQLQWLLLKILEQIYSKGYYKTRVGTSNITNEQTKRKTKQTDQRRNEQKRLWFVVKGSYKTKQDAEAAAQRCFVKKMFLEISQSSQEKTYARISFLIKLEGLGLQLFLKRGFITGIFLRILQNF